MALASDPIRRSRSITPGQTTALGRSGVVIACSGDGWVRLVLVSGDTMDVYIQTGTFQISDVLVTGVATTSAFTPLATNVVVNVTDF